jgi:hypothetical protein
VTIYWAYRHCDRLSSYRQLLLNLPGRGVRCNVDGASGGALDWRLSVKQEKKTLDIYRGADKSLARPTSRYILFEG